MEFPGLDNGVNATPSEFNSFRKRSHWPIWNSESTDIPYGGLAEVYDVCDFSGAAGVGCLKVRKPTISGATNIVVVMAGCFSHQAGEGTTEDAPYGLQVPYDPGTGAPYDPMVGDFLGAQAGSYLPLRGQPIGLLKVLSVDTTNKVAMCRICEAGPQLYKVTTAASGSTVKAKMIDSIGAVVGPEITFFYGTF